MSFIIAVVGDSMLDQYIYGESYRLSPEAPVPVVKTTDVSYSPGGAAHVASSIQSLGHPAVLFTAVGPDDEGKKLLFGLNTLNVTYFSVEMPEWQTTVKTRVIANGHQLLRYDRERSIATSPSYANLSESISTRLAAMASDLNAIVVSDYNKHTISAYLRDDIQNLKQRNPGIRLFVDSKPCNLSKWYAADCVTPNFAEAAEFLDERFHTNNEAAKNDKLCEDMAKRLSLAIPSLSLAVITRAQHGCSWYDKTSNSYGSLPAFDTCKNDVIGAGDTFIAALAVAFGEGKATPDAMTFANSAAALAVGKPGTTVVHRMELDNYMAGVKTSMSSSKILSHSEAINWSRQLRTTGGKVVFTNGCFDLFHAGHLHLLEQAKLSGDYLIVGVSDDDSVKTIKGRERPIIDLKSRLRLVAALECVDAVISFSESQLEPIISALRPSMLVKGSEYSGKLIVGLETAQAMGGKLVLIDMLEGTSTSSILASMQPPSLCSSCQWCIDAAQPPLS